MWPGLTRRFITGESGTGKEIVAHAVHAQSPRASNMFAPVNCAGLPETLLESELFGHVRGSFTGAYRDKPGKLESAHNGTVFLDEGEMTTLRMQGMLLRFLETGELQKVGADGGGRIVNVRIITATNRNLRELITQVSSVRTCSTALNVIHLMVPPFARSPRRHPCLLTEHFITLPIRQRFSDHRHRAPNAMKALMDYAWPETFVSSRTSSNASSSPSSATWCVSEDLPSEVREHDTVAVRPKRERRRTVADDLCQTIGRRQGVVLDVGVSAVHGPRNHPLKCPRRRATRTRRSPRQL